MHRHHTAFDMVLHNHDGFPKRFSDIKSQIVPILTRKDIRPGRLELIVLRHVNEPIICCSDWILQGDVEIRPRELLQPSLGHFAVDWRSLRHAGVNIAVGVLHF